MRVEIWYIMRADYIDRDIENRTEDYLRTSCVGDHVHENSMCIVFRILLNSPLVFPVFIKRNIKYIEDLY